MALILDQILSDLRISQRELSRRSGVTQAHISLILKGKTDPSIGTLEKIADGLGCEVPDLFNRERVRTFTCPHCGKEICAQVDTATHIKFITKNSI